MKRCKDAKVQRKEQRLKYILNKEKNKSSESLSLYNKDDGRDKKEKLK